METVEVPHLRIISSELWDTVRSRQGALISKATPVPVWDRRRPKTVFSGLMQCGCCGAGFSKVSKDSFGCSGARNKGDAFCRNKRVIKQKDLEAAVLGALAEHLMDPEAVALFCAEYTAERNRLATRASDGRASIDHELAQVKRDHSKLVEAIIAGVPADQVKDKMVELDARRKALELQLASMDHPAPVMFHPGMAAHYREQVGSLIKSLNEADHMETARETLRALIDKIVLTPEAEGTGLSIDVHGALGSLLRLALGLPVVGAVPQTQKAPRVAGLVGSSSVGSEGSDLEATDMIGELSLVAGACICLD